MATTTTNFGWDIPQSTDLVKDGATAIATLGQDIDTALIDLKGGTSGQVLSKASNTDLDFTWVAQDDSNAIQNSIVDAKGDLIAATANDTPARLGVGTNNQVLMADSTTATGLKWGTPSTGGLTFITSATASTGTLSINNCFSSTYKNYLLEVNLTTSTNCNLAIRYRAGGSDNTSGVYNSSYYYTYLQAGNTGTAVAGAATSLNLHVSNLNRKWEGPLSVMNPNAAIETTCSYNAIVIDNSGWFDFQGGGVFIGSNQFDGISFIASAGTLAGTVKVYGYQD